MAEVPYREDEGQAVAGLGGWCYRGLRVPMGQLLLLDGDSIIFPLRFLSFVIGDTSLQARCIIRSSWRYPEGLTGYVDVYLDYAWLNNEMGIIYHITSVALRPYHSLNSS